MQNENTWCSGRDSNPGPRLSFTHCVERPLYLTGLYYRSANHSSISFAVYFCSVMFCMSVHCWDFDFQGWNLQFMTARWTRAAKLRQNAFKICLVLVRSYVEFRLWVFMYHRSALAATENEGHRIQLQIAESDSKLQFCCMIVAHSEYSIYTIYTNHLKALRHK